MLYVKVQSDTHYSSNNHVTVCFLSICTSFKNVFEKKDMYSMMCGLSVVLHDIFLNGNYISVHS